MVEAGFYLIQCDEFVHTYYTHTHTHTQANDCLLL